MRNACYSGPSKPLQFVRDEITSTSTPSCTLWHEAIVLELVRQQLLQQSITPRYKLFVRLSVECRSRHSNLQAGT